MTDDHNWQELIDRHLRGELDDSEKEQLAEQLDSDPSARKEFVEHVQWDTQLADALREAGASCDPPARKTTGVPDHAAPVGRTSTGTFTRLLLAAATLAVVVLGIGLFLRGPADERPIATVTGVSGSLQWTGDGGRVFHNLNVGSELAGGTVEGMGPDSWFELEFKDGSTVTISGNSMLTLSDDGQKVLHLKEGNLSANVRPQPVGRPMLIHTRSALLKVLGTQFEVETEPWATILNVNAGTVQVERVGDGKIVDVAANHRVIAAPDRDLSPVRVPDSVSRWKSQLHRGPRGTHGEWVAASADRSARLRGVPFVPSDFPTDTLYMLGLAVSRDDGSRVVIRSDSRFVLRGRIGDAPRVFFGIQVARANGEFAGKFRADQAVSSVNERGEFEAVLDFHEFDLDPCVQDRRDELPASPDGLFLTSVWCFAVKQETGTPDLELTDIELVTSDEAGPAATP